MTSEKNLKQQAFQAIEHASTDLHEVSKSIWSHPELCFQEHHAHKTLTDYLEKMGFQVERSYLLETAFRATYGAGHPHISVLCEYDALPQLGHGCGHNLIAEVGAAAGVGIMEAMKQGGVKGKLTVMGTPAEEGGGGKIDLVNKGAFKDIDVTMMAHPAWYNGVDTTPLASTGMTCTFHGKASHAAGFPWEGINALDAAVLAYNNIACLRQQLKPSCRVGIIITNGGTKPNIIPEESAMAFTLRATTSTDLEMVVAKVNACLESAATATRCTVNIKRSDKPYYNVIHDDFLRESYVKNAADLGINIMTDPAVLALPLGSTDFGNLSHHVPGLHPVFYVGKEVALHTQELVKQSGKPEAQPYALKQGKALAATAIDVFCNPGVVSEMKAKLQEKISS